jgi:hypothetical protein
MYKKLLKNENTITKLTLGFFMLTLLLSVFLIVGCKEQNAVASKNVNVPMPMVSSFIGDSKLKIFHKITCKYRPTRGDIVYFDSPIGAVHSGYKACKECKPDQP